LAFNLRTSDAAAAVRRDAPAANHSVDSPPHHESVFVAHEDDHATSLAGPEARSARVIHAHCIGGERASLSEAHKFKGIDAQVNSASDGHLEIARNERRATVYDGE
jgi:hypothetical protein